MEFLRDAGDAQPGRLVTVDAERISALTIRYAGIVHDWFQECTVTGELLDGGGVSTEVVRCADVPSFVILKALALDDRPGLAALRRRFCDDEHADGYLKMGPGPSHTRRSFANATT